MSTFHHLSAMITLLAAGVGLLLWTGAVAVFAGRHGQIDRA